MSRCQQPREESLETKDEAGKRGQKNTEARRVDNSLSKFERIRGATRSHVSRGRSEMGTLSLFLSHRQRPAHPTPRNATPKRLGSVGCAKDCRAGDSPRSKVPGSGPGGCQGPAGRECPAAWHPWLLWGSLGELTPAGMKDIWGFQQAGQCSPSSCAPWNPSRVGTIRRASYKPTQPSPAQP